MGASDRFLTYRLHIPSYAQRISKNEAVRQKIEAEILFPYRGAHTTSSSGPDNWQSVSLINYLVHQ